MNLYVGAFLILIITALNTALLGNYLVLRELSMLADAISHAVLLGIVIAFFIARDLTSPLLFFGAGFIGLLLVILVEEFQKRKNVSRDAIVGLVYPLFFSLAIILISRYARNVHLDTDVVFMGDALLSAFDTRELWGYNVPKDILNMLGMLVLNSAAWILFFKELKLSCFDSEYALMQGFRQGPLFYLFMTLCSFTTVSAFNAVGAILVVSFLIVPPCTAAIWTKRLHQRIFLSLAFAVLHTLIGFVLSLSLNLSMAGMIAFVGMMSFLLQVLLKRFLARKKGISSNQGLVEQ